MNMQASDKIAFKNSLKQFCQHTIEQRMSAAKAAIGHAQDAANSEEKSSAGDKYETSRAMGHLQKDMHARQLTEYVKELGVLHQVNTGKIYDTVNAGAFIETGEASFFIAAGLGRQSFEGRSIYFLSPYAPLAQTMMNMRNGAQFVFNNKAVVITDIY